jgi:hypothetical protein
VAPPSLGRTAPRTPAGTRPDAPARAASGSARAATPRHEPASSPIVSLTCPPANASAEPVCSMLRTEEAGCTAWACSCSPVQASARAASSSESQLASASSRLCSPAAAWRAAATGMSPAGRASDVQARHRSVVGAARQKGNPGATARRSAFRLSGVAPGRSRIAAARAVRAIGLRSSSSTCRTVLVARTDASRSLVTAWNRRPPFLTAAGLAISMRQARTSGSRSSSAISSSSHSMSGRVLVRGSPTISTSVVAPHPTNPTPANSPKGIGGVLIRIPYRISLWRRLAARRSVEGVRFSSAAKSPS